MKEIRCPKCDKLIRLTSKNVVDEVEFWCWDCDLWMEIDKEDLQLIRKRRSSFTTQRVDLLVRRKQDCNDWYGTYNRKSSRWEVSAWRYNGRCNRSIGLHEDSLPDWLHESYSYEKGLVETARAAAKMAEQEEGINGGGKNKGQLYETNSSPLTSLPNQEINQVDMKQQKEANMHYAEAKTAALMGKVEEAIHNYQLAKDNYKDLAAQGVNCQKRLDKIKNRMKDLQGGLTGSASSGSQKASDSELKAFEGEASTVEEQNVKSGEVPLEGGVINAKRLAQSLVKKSSEFTLGQKLGSGGFGEVYRGTFNREQVAIKKLHMQDLSEKMKREFAQEVQFMAELRYPRIVQLYGICLESGSYCIIMQYMSRGSLYDVLHVKRERLLWSVRWKIAYESCLGISFLHEQNIIHRDIKSPNILLDRNMEAKIGDFGLATLKKETSKSQAGQKTERDRKNPGTTAWMAPELFCQGAKATKQSDVYAVGMVFWEMASEKIPFENAESYEQLVGWIVTGQKEQVPRGCPPRFAELIGKCWKERTKRPSIEEVLKDIKSVCEKGQIKTGMSVGQSAR